MDSTLVCRINPFCKRLQTGIICPHMQGVSTSKIFIQPLPPLRRLPPLQHPPVSPITVFPSTTTVPQVIPPPPPPSPVIRTQQPLLHQPLPIRQIPLQSSSPLPPLRSSQPLSTGPSPFRPILIRQRTTY